ncbi:MAG: hypothetical protein ACOX86_09620 [Pelotomaculaceae bacterium]|jgi:hypothetical protein|nr:hypothetical protein [Peptococcaceae bacterium]
MVKDDLNKNDWSLTFEEFWKHLRKEAEGVKMDVLFEAGCLEMQWSFSEQRTKLRVIKLLQQCGAKYQEGHSSVCFWIKTDKHGQMNLVPA